MKCKRVLGPTDCKYKILCAGKEFDLGVGRPITVLWNGKRYTAKMHTKTKGRIDGLARLYSDADFQEGDELELTFEESTQTVIIEHISSWQMPPVASVQPQEPTPQTSAAWPDSFETKNVSVGRQEASEGAMSDTEFSRLWDFWRDTSSNTEPEVNPMAHTDQESDESEPWLGNAVQKSRKHERRTPAVQQNTPEPMWPKVEFRGEYYNSDFAYISMYGSAKRQIAKCGDNYYFLDTNSSRTLRICPGIGQPYRDITLRSNYNGGEGIFANQYGVFIYTLDRAKGVVCELFSHDGKRKKKFTLKKGEHTTKLDKIRGVYFKDSVFYAVTRQEYIVYDFANEQERRSPLYVPENWKVINMTMDNEHLYIKLENELTHIIWWANQPVSWGQIETEGEMELVIPELAKRDAPFLHPREGLIWVLETQTQRNMVGYGNDGAKISLTYIGYDIQDGTPRYRYGVTGEMLGGEVLYFDGKTMYAKKNRDSDNLYAWDEAKQCWKRIQGTFLCDRLLVQDGMLCTLKDYGNMVHYLSLFPVGREEDEPQKLCPRLW